LYLKKSKRQLEIQNQASNDT